MLSGTGRSLAIQSLEHRRKVFLRRYVDDVEHFLAVMRDTRTVIGGSACLPMLRGEEYWAPTDIDLFCPKDSYETMCIYVVDRLRGRMIEHLDEENLHREYPSDCPQGVCDRRRILTEKITFDIMCSPSLTATEPIAHSFATHTMNFVAADSVCIAYPLLFSARRSVLRPSSLWTDPSDLVTKYLGRGYEFHSCFLYESQGATRKPCATNGHCPRALRYFGDLSCFTMSLACEEDVLTLYLPKHLPPFGNPSPTLAWTTAWVFGGEACHNESCNVHTDSHVQPLVLCDIDSLV